MAYVTKSKYRVDKESWADWTDTLLLVICGGIPWQVKFSINNKSKGAYFYQKCKKDIDQT